MTSSYSRQRREDLFASIARGKGGATKLLLEPEVLAQAQRKLEELKPKAVAEIRGATAGIRLLAEGRSESEKIFAVAHDIKNRPPGFEPDWPLLQLLIQTMTRTFDDSTAVSPQMLATMCHEAVTKVMTREGREIPEGVF